MGNLVIVAIPDENDRVWKVSSEKVPHLTLLFLGDAEGVKNVDQIVQFVEHAANTTLKRFYMPVDRRGELGEDKADVLFFRRNRYDSRALYDFRSQLLKEPNIKTAYDSATQFEGQWKPHLTLGYPESPAKPQDPDNDFAFYDVSFTKIAVWMGDFEGPEFDLRDYWDDWDAQETMPLDIAMSAVGESGPDIKHYGVKGMQWGVRRAEKKADKEDKKFTEAASSAAVYIKIHNRAAELTNAHDIDRINNSDKWKDADFSKEDWDNPSGKYDSYIKEHQQAFVSRAEQAAKEMSPSKTGRLKYEVVSDSDGNWGVVATPVKDRVAHAAEGELEEHSFLVEVIRDPETKRVKSLVVAEVSMAQCAFDEEFFIEHYGVKGMRWGVRKAGDAGKSVGRGAAAAYRFGKDVHFEVKAEDGRARNKIISSASKEFKKKDGPLDAIKAKPEFSDAKKLKNRLRHPRDPHTKAYRKEAKAAYIKQLEASANSMKNASGDRQYTIRERGVELPAGGSNTLPKSKYFWDVSTRKVEHGAIKDTDPFTRIELMMDEDGYIVDLRPVPIDDSLEQSMELGQHFLASLGVSPAESLVHREPSPVLIRGAEFLSSFGIDVELEPLDESMEHYGVKGMKWGVRRGAPEAVATTSTVVVPHGAKRKTKIEVAGGENHTASPDAVKVAEAKAKLKKSGAAALSNNELRDVATRMQLERQVTDLTKSSGAKFIDRLFTNQANQQANRVVDREARKLF